MRARQMALTPNLVARVHRVVEDTGPAPGFIRRTDSDHDAAVQSVLAARLPGRDVWLFAYSSLI